MVQVGTALGRIAVNLGGQIVQSANSGGRQGVQEGVFPGRQGPAEILHGDGQSGTESRDIVAMQVDVEVTCIPERKSMWK